ncbi:MAG: hypothetical protein ACFFH0_01630 [Promethearchaeota archaeon]
MNGDQYDPWLVLQYDGNAIERTAFPVPKTSLSKTYRTNRRGFLTEMK